MENSQIFYFSPENIGNRFAYRKLKIRDTMEMTEKRNETVMKVNEFIKKPHISMLKVIFSIDDLSSSYISQFMK